MNTETTLTSTSSKPKIALSRLLVAGLASVLAAVVANLITRAVLFALLDLPAEFPPLQPPAIIIFTVIGTGLGALVYAVLTRLSRNPPRVYLIVAAVAFVISILPNLGAVANPSAAPMPFPGASAQAFAALIVFHVVAAVVSVFVLLRLTRAG